MPEPSMSTSHVLPMELALLLLESVTDLKALDALRRTSKCFESAFRRIGVTLMNDLVQSTLTARLRREMIVCANILTDRHAGGNAIRPPLDKNEVLGLYAQHPYLTRKTPRPVLLRVLHAFSAIASHTDALLYRCLERLHTLPHEHLAEEYCPDLSRLHRRQPSCTKLEDFGTPYTIKSPPRALAWDEQQRMLLAMWRAVNYQQLGKPNDFAVASLGTYHMVRHQLNEMRFANECLAIEAEDGIGIDAQLANFPISWRALAELPPSRAPAFPETIDRGDTSETIRASVSFMSSGGHF